LPAATALFEACSTLVAAENFGDLAAKLVSID